ncbi:Na+/H+ antiporter NhaC [Salibacterium aidingense]|uniref:Na+/H+ antiporter NhaC n=1 Tax=Salibacterium aidingense TaxID=384933 RepID=UPI003BDE8C9E
MENYRATVKGSAIVMLIIVAVLTICFVHYGVAPQIPLIIGSMVVAIYGVKLGYTWADMEKSIVKVISQGMPAILILSFVGTLIGVWVLNGTVQTITFYGLQVLSPSVYLVSTVIITSIVSTVTGTSFGSIGTIGVSLMGVAYGMGVDPALAAGAIVSGAIFGNKLSPLSDTTNLAAASTNTDVFEHIRHMLWTTIPAFVIALIVFGCIDLFYSGSADTGDISEMMQVMQSEFPISMVTLSSPLLILGLAVKGVKPLPSLASGLIVAAFSTFITVPGSTMGDIMTAAHSGISVDTGNASVDELLSLGGLESMLFGVSLIIVALAFGGLIQGVGIAQALIQGMQKALRSRGNTVASTLASGFGVNAITGEQYLSIVLPGQMYDEAYRKHNLHPKNLSRTLEDGGTMLNPIIPWGVSGAFVMTTLNVGMDYVFFVFFSLATPVIALFYAYTGISLTPLDDKSEPEEEDEINHQEDAVGDIRY